MAGRLRIGLFSALLVAILALSVSSMIAHASIGPAHNARLALAGQPLPTPTPAAPAPPVLKEPAAQTGEPAVYKLPAPVWELPATTSIPQIEKPHATLTTGAIALAGNLSIAYEGFEGLFPGPGWSLFDTSSDGFERLWGDVNVLPFAGGWSGWPGGRGADALDPFTFRYANDMDSWLIYGPFDLSDAATAETTFQLWRAIEPNFDYLAFLISTDGSLFFEQTRWDGYADWIPVQQRLDDYLGQPAVWVAWYFHTDFSVTDVGPFVDEITITKFVDGCTEVGGVMACAIIAGAGWQSTGLAVTAGQPYFVDYRAGAWTMDINNFAFVGPEGYPPEIDGTLGDFCKVDTSLPYGMLLGQIGSGAVVPIGVGGGFTAPADGLLSLRINDADGCLADNAGAILLRVRNRDEFTLQVSQTGNGFVTVEPAQATYFYGEVVNVTASPDPGWTFREWQGARTGQHNPAFIVMDGDKSVQATFVDRTGPQVNWLFPVGNTEVYSAACGETVALEVAANDGSGVSYVQFQRWDAVNNVWVQLGFDDTPPYQSSVDVCTLNLGWNQVNAEVFDWWGNWSYSYIWVDRATVGDLFDFSATPRSGPAPLNVRFHLTPTAPITFCQWDYGDGATGDSCASQHEHLYLASGSYTVGLTINGPDGIDTEVRSAYIQVTKPALRFGAAIYSIAENVGSATLQVLLSEAATVPVTVQYATSNGTATAGSDYTAANNTLTFAPGETSKNIAVTILPDTLDENDETVNLALTGPVNAVLGAPANGVLTITDDDDPPAVRFGAATFTVDEDAGSAPIAVALSAPSALPITVNYATGNGSATAGNDYTAVSNTLTFSPGETTKSFTVQVLEDAVDEPDETINLTLSNPTNASLGGPANATLTITDNDDSPGIQAAFVGTPTSGAKPLSVTFTDQSAGTVNSWAWSFGDGGASNQRNPTHTYNSAGAFTVVLTVTGPGGSHSATKTAYIQVSEPLPATPTLNPIANSDQDGIYSVTWNNAANASSYELQEQQNGGAWNSIHTGAALTVNLTGKTDGSWCYRIRATNAAGPSDWSTPQCTTVAAAPRPQLTIAQAVDGAPGGTVSLALSFAAQGQNVSSLLFSIDFDEQRLSFSTVDSDNNCAPDAIQFSAALPASFIKCADFDAADTNGEIDVRIADFSATPRTLSSGVLLTMTFAVRANAADSLAPVRFALASFGGAQGELNGSTIAGSVRILGAPAVIDLSSSSSTLVADGAATAAITAHVKDVAGRGLPGYPLSFATTLGAITPAQTTDAQGNATATLTSAATVGVATVTASAGNVQQTIQISFVKAPPVGPHDSEVFLPMIAR
jgi:PKD repeat protein